MCGDPPNLLAWALAGSDTLQEIAGRIRRHLVSTFDVGRLGLSLDPRVLDAAATRSAPVVEALGLRLYCAVLLGGFITESPLLVVVLCSLQHGVDFVKAIDWNGHSCSQCQNRWAPCFAAGCRVEKG